MTSLTRSRLCLLLVSLLTAPAVLAQAAGSAQRSHDGWFMIGVLLLAAAIGVHALHDNGVLNSRQAETGSVIGFWAGALLLWATHGNTWTWTGLTQAVGFNQDKPLAARPFFDEAAASARLQQIAAQATAQQREHELRIQREQQRQQLGQLQQQQQSTLLDTDNQVASTEGELRSLRQRKQTMVVLNPDISGCAFALGKTVDQQTWQGDDTLTKVAAPVASAVCTYEYLSDDRFHRRVNEFTSQFGELGRRERQLQQQLSRLQSQQAGARQELQRLGLQLQQLQ